MDMMHEDFTSRIQHNTDHYMKEIKWACGRCGDPATEWCQACRAVWQIPQKSPLCQECKDRHCYACDDSEENNRICEHYQRMYSP